MKRKLLAGLLIAAVSASMITACGSSQTTDSTSTDSSAAETTESASEDAEAATTVEDTASSD